MNWQNNLCKFLQEIVQLISKRITCTQTHIYKCCVCTELFYSNIFLIEKLTFSLHKKKCWISLCSLICWFEEEISHCATRLAAYGIISVSRANATFFSVIRLWFFLTFIGLNSADGSAHRLLSEGQKRVIKNPGFLCTYPLIYHMGNQYSHH